MKAFLLKKVLPWLVVFAIFSIVITRCNHLRNENKRLSDNQTALLDAKNYFENCYGESQASVQQLVLTKNEFQKLETKLVDEIERLGIKIKRLESVSQTTSETDIEIKTIVKDSIVFVHGKTDTIRCFDYKDTWNTLMACEKNDTLTASLHIRDTLIQAVYREPKKFLFFRWGTKAIRQEIVSKNPYTKITYSEYISIKRN
ncbi:MAG: hypothetical protein LBU91_03200 [Bacteroidales bacterium]|jgi:hypothetical protein|nr:hypothetical protein [Bacteroidales bacterium]